MPIEEKIRDIQELEDSAETYWLHNVLFPKNIRAHKGCKDQPQGRTLQECSKQKDEGSGVLSQMWANRSEGPE